MELGGDHSGWMKRPLTKAQRSAICQAAGAGIARMRARAGLTQDEVAEALGVGPEAVSRIERGVVDPGISRIVELAELFRCGVDELLISASGRHQEQAAEIAEELAKLPAKEREAVAAIVRQLGELLRPKAKRQVDKG